MHSLLLCCRHDANQANPHRPHRPIPYHFQSRQQLCPCCLRLRQQRHPRCTRKNCRDETILATYKTVHARLCAADLHPKLQHLDNEASQALQDFLSAKHVDYQLVPPHVHHHNATERSICTFKNHLIAGLCSMHKNFQLHLWVHL